MTSADDWGRVISALVARWGGLDLLVNNAGISPRGTVETTDEALWDRTLAINLKGAWLGIKAAMPTCASAGARLSTSVPRGPRGPCRGCFRTSCPKQACGV